MADHPHSNDSIGWAKAHKSKGRKVKTQIAIGQNNGLVTEVAFLMLFKLVVLKHFQDKDLQQIHILCQGLPYKICVCKMFQEYYTYLSTYISLSLSFF